MKHWEDVALKKIRKRKDQCFANFLSLSELNLHE